MRAPVDDRNTRDLLADELALAGVDARHGPRGRARSRLPRSCARMRSLAPARRNGRRTRHQRVSTSVPRYLPSSRRTRGVVTFEDISPAAVPERGRPLGRVHEVGEEHGREHRVGHRGRSLRRAGTRAPHRLHRRTYTHTPLAAELHDHRARDAIGDVARLVATLDSRCRARGSGRGSSPSTSVMSVSIAIAPELGRSRRARREPPVPDEPIERSLPPRPALDRTARVRKHSRKSRSPHECRGSRRSHSRAMLLRRRRRVGVGADRCARDGIEESKALAALGIGGRKEGADVRGRICAEERCALDTRPRREPR